MIGREEWTIMQIHPLIGANVLREAGVVNEEVIKLVQNHHERPGGTGYPLGIEPSPADIILAACDVFSSCVEKREYRESPLTRQQVFNEIMKFSPPEIVKAVHDSISDYYNLLDYNPYYNLEIKSIAK